jgi:4-hydroxybenzoate polyprenyltransferase
MILFSETLCLSQKAPLFYNLFPLASHWSFSWLASLSSPTVWELLGARKAARAHFPFPLTASNLILLILVCEQRIAGYVLNDYEP